VVSPSARFAFGRAPQQQTGTAWHQTFAAYLLLEWLLLLVYAIIWRVTSNLSQQAGVQILLLCVQRLGMGIQGALVWAFKIPGVVAECLTATLITLGHISLRTFDHRGPESQEWRWSGMFLALLCLVYVASAFVVALTSAFMLTPVVPSVVVTIATSPCLFIPPTRHKPSNLILRGQKREEVRKKEGGQGRCTIVLAACAKGQEKRSGISRYLSPQTGSPAGGLDALLPLPAS